MVKMVPLVHVTQLLRRPGCFVFAQVQIRSSKREGVIREWVGAILEVKENLVTIQLPGAFERVVPNPSIPGLHFHIR